MRASRCLIGFVLSVAAAGCYSLRPAAAGVPEPGSEVAFGINDLGRLALGGSMGPEIDRVDGRLVESSSGEHVVAVSSVHLLRGGVQVWSGERVRIKSEYVQSTYMRHFSTSRTLALGATIGGVTAFVVAGKLLGSGDANKPVPVDTTPDQLRGRP